MKRKLNFMLAALCIAMLISCEKQQEIDVTPVFKEKISGFVQKGPFINGSAITISELNARMGQTGKTFNAQILNNEGAFELTDIELASNYVELKANGFYFNEVSGTTSDAPLTLYAFADLKEISTLNVNILSHLEKNRIAYLVSHGTEFATAKKQAQKEVLAIFSINKENMAQSDLLNIAQTGDDNAILLAVSLIAQGFRTEAELSELLANISTDISTDGKLDDLTLGSALLNHAKLLNLKQIRTNLEERYTNLGAEASIPEFERFVNQFITNTTYTYSNNIVYPETGLFGQNVLFGNRSTIAVGEYSITANLPKGTSLKIVVTSDRVAFGAFPDTPVNFTLSNNTLTSVESGKSCDIKFVVRPAYTFFEYTNNNIVIDIYENGNVTPTHTKTIDIEEDK
jgi:hypothetical protein